MALQVDNLRGRVSNVANKLDKTVMDLNVILAHADAAVFGFRPTATSDDAKEAAIADSIEGEIGRIERLADRLYEITRSAAEFQQRLSGNGTKEGVLAPEPARRYA